MKIDGTIPLLWVRAWLNQTWFFFCTIYFHPTVKLIVDRICERLPPCACLTLGYHSLQTRVSRHRPGPSIVVGVVKGPQVWCLRLLGTLLWVALKETQKENHHFGGSTKKRTVPFVHTCAHLSVFFFWLFCLFARFFFTSSVLRW